MAEDYLSSDEPSLIPATTRSKQSGLSIDDNSYGLRRREYHAYRQVTLNHNSQAHLGDVFHHSATYHTHNHQYSSPPRVTASSWLEAWENYPLTVQLLLVGHTSASLANIWPSLGLFTWHRHVEVLRWVRFGAASCLLKHTVLFGLAFWDVNWNDGEVILRQYSDQLVLCWLVLTIFNVPRTLKFVDMVEADGGIGRMIQALIHVSGEIAELITCSLYLKQQWLTQ